MATKTRISERMEMLLIEEADAWYQYLEDTMEVHGPQYTEVESWAWERLTTRLRKVTKQRGKVEQLFS
jgi:hypothetical protein